MHKLLDIHKSATKTAQDNNGISKRNDKKGENITWKTRDVVLCSCSCKKVKGNSRPYMWPSTGPRADPGVQVVSSQVTLSHPPGGRLPLLSARPAVTFPAEQRHRPLASTKLYCLVTEAHGCEQLAQGYYLTARWPGLELATSPMP